MECHQAQAQLEFMTLGRDPVSAPDAQGLQRHLAECDECHLALESQREFDATVARAMADVPLPPGLTERLLSSVNGLALKPESVSAKPNPNRRRSSWRWAGAGVIALLLPLLVWGLLGPRLPALNDASVRQLAELDLNSLPADSRQVDVTPPGWSSLRNVQFGGEARLAPLNGTDVPVLPFLARTDRRSAHVSGFMVRMPLSQWHAPVDTASFSSATIQYASFGTWVVWREGESVYVCVLRGDAHVMQRFQDLVAGSRELT